VAIEKTENALHFFAIVFLSGLAGGLPPYKK
jgi:hypothetical protein